MNLDTLSRLVAPYSMLPLALPVLAACRAGDSEAALTSAKALRDWLPETYLKGDLRAWLRTAERQTI